MAAQTPYLTKNNNPKLKLSSIKKNPCPSDENFYYELENLLEKIWKEEKEKEARLKRHVEVAKEHWIEVAAVRKKN